MTSVLPSGYLSRFSSVISGLLSQIVRDKRIALTHSLIIAHGSISACLILHFRIQLGSENKNIRGKVEPEEQCNHGTDRASAGSNIKPYTDKKAAISPR